MPTPLESETNGLTKSHRTHSSESVHGGARAGGIFRGWFVVAAGFVALFVVYALQFSFGEFRLAATEAEGWSQSSLSLVFSIYIGLYGAYSAISGWSTDRFGPRLTIGIGSVLLCAGYGLFALSQTFWLVVLGLAVIAPIGMSCSWVPVNATAVRWFVERRGLATALVTSGGSVGNIVGPPVAAVLIVNFGWRVALGAMALAGLVLLLAASSQMVRDPESVGLHPDGALAAPEADETGPSLTAPEAMRSRVYWLLWGMYSLSFIVVFVPLVHGSAFAVDLGIARITAATVVSAIGIGGLIGRLIIGAVSDRIDRRFAAIGSFALQTAAFLAMASAGGLAMLYPAAAAFGFGYGGAVAVFPALVGDYFGRAHAGAIVGRMFASAGSLAAIGPYVAALIFDATDSYRAAFVVAAGLNALAVMLSFGLRSATAARSTPAAGRQRT